MNRLRRGILAAALFSTLVCLAWIARRDRGGPTPENSLAVTIQPLATILREIAGKRATVIPLVPASASPHTFEPSPEQMRLCQSARALFWVGPELDGWAAKLPTRRSVAVFSLVPESFKQAMVFEDHDHGEGHEAEPGEAGADPHFWTDPLTVKAILPSLVKVLAEIDPEGRGAYEANGARFALELDALNAEIAAALKGIEGAPVVLFHPSFGYLLNRYGLRLAGLIEPFPGKEPSPRELGDLIKRLKEFKVKAIFTEPQLSPRPAHVVAEAARLPLFELDPNGGISGRETYDQLIRYNARTLREALH